MSDAGLILVADDNEAARYSKSRTLRRAGFEVVEAANGTDALRLAAELMPRMILLDVQMPDIDGLEVCRRLKANPVTASILVLQVSATHVREEDTVRALEGGADASLTEPFDASVLVATTRALLRARLAEDALRQALDSEHAARMQAETANRMKDDFLATLSHELRTPLNAILTWVTLLRSGRVDPSRSTHGLEVVERNTRLQMKLIEDLLDVSRIMSGKLHLEIAALDLVKVVEAAADSVRPVAEAKGLRLRVSAHPSTFNVLGDAGRLQQVVSNLLHNAVKFTPKGGRLDVSLSCVDSYAQIVVADSGQGIQEDFLPHIFERFRQADSSTTRAAGGLGLGLAIVRNLIELHGGTVSVDSPGLGKGATFTVRLPVPAVSIALPEMDSARVAHDSQFAQTQSLQAIRTLVVDDDADAREAIAAVLEGSGALVQTARSVAEALELLEVGSYDVIVSDIAMPERDGYSLIQEVRARPDDLARIPALVLTAHGGREEQRRVIAAGYNGFLSKPVEAPELIAVVTRLALAERKSSRSESS